MTRLAPLLWLAIVGLLACWGSSSPPRRADAGEKPNVVLITLDTTRADRLGSYGYEGGTTPNLDRLARDSIVYARAVATSSWTLPSHASIFTGKLPISHGARYDPHGPLSLVDGARGPKEWREIRARGIAPGERTLASLLREDGYVTGAVVGGPWLKKVFGLHAGFEFYDDSRVTDVIGARASDVTNSALRFLNQVGGRRFFLFLNYFDPHGPYAPPLTYRLLSMGPRYWILRADLTPETRNALYDAEIRFMDQHVGRLLDELEERGLYDDTLIVVTADHGELLGEHGKLGHGRYLTQQELSVPLIVKLPSGDAPPARHDGRVSIAGIFPLVLRRVGLEVPLGVQASVPPDGSQPVIAETYPLSVLSGDGWWRAYFEGEEKFLWNSLGSHELYDLARDPAEKINLVGITPDRAERMHSDLQELIDRAPKPGAAGPEQNVDDETRKALESLGYIE